MAAYPEPASEITYLDLLSLEYPDFRRELMLTHTSLQRTASEGVKILKVTEYDYMKWWYSVIPLSAGSRCLPAEWHALATASDYQNMLETVTGYLDPTELTIELTNDLSFISSDNRFPTWFNSSTLQHSEDSPCFIRLSKTPIVALPSAEFRTKDHSDNTHAPNPPLSTDQNSLQDSVKIVSIQERDRGPDECAPQHCNTTVSHLELTSQDSNPQDQRTSFSVESSKNLFDADYFALTKVALEFSPKSARQKSHKIVPEIHKPADKPTGLPQILSLEHPIEKDLIFHSSSKSLKLYIRPAKSISRRYSIPFDSHTPGLNGLSVAECIRWTVPLASSSDNIDCINLASDSRTNCGADSGHQRQNSSSLPFVFVEGLNGRDYCATDSAMCWGEEILERVSNL